MDFIKKEHTTGGVLCLWAASYYDALGNIFLAITKTNKLNSTTGIFVLLDTRKIFRELLWLRRDTLLTCEVSTPRKYLNPIRMRILCWLRNIFAEIHTSFKTWARMSDLLIWSRDIYNLVLLSVSLCISSQERNCGSVIFVRFDERQNDGWISITNCVLFSSNY